MTRYDVWHFRLFEFFVSIFDLLVHDARKDGQFDSGIVDIQASRIDLHGVPKVKPWPSLSVSLRSVGVQLL